MLHHAFAPQPVSRPKRTRPSLGQVLIDQFSLKSEHLLIAHAIRKHRGCKLETVLLDKGFITASDLQSALSYQYGCPSVDPTKHQGATSLLTTTDAAFWINNKAIPIICSGRITIACAEPERFEDIVDHLPLALTPDLAIATEQSVTNSILRHYGDHLTVQAEQLTPDGLSCRSWNHQTFQRLSATLVIVLISTAVISAKTTLLFLTSIALLAMVSVTLLRLAALFSRKLAQPSHHPEKPLPSVSVLVPLYQEKHIASHLIKRLERLTYPKELLDVCLILEADDDTTRAALADISLPHWMRVIQAPKGNLRTKPKAMNCALPFLESDIIGIYDAEDAPEPDQITQVAEHFRSAGPNVACVQGVLDYYNNRRNWMARCFTIEYATWFRVLLPGLDRLGLIVPLGGTTLFFRRDVLKDLGGWDAHNVTEDADLGIRLARAGYRTDCLPVTTYEEANCRPWPWIKQRSRWIKGFILTYATHMRRPKALIRDVGWWRFVGVQILLLGTILQFTLAPVLWSYWLIAFGLAHPVTSVGTPIIALFVGAALVTFSVNFIATKAKERRHLLPWIPLMAFYNPFGTLAAYKAIFELLFKPFYWDKTSHGHLSD